MLTEIPYDVQSIIYKNLDPKTRARMRLSISKRKFAYGHLYKEKMIAIADNYIRRHKEALKLKKKYLPVTMQNFLLREANKCNKDGYIRKILRDIEITVDSDNDDDSQPILFGLNKLLYLIEVNWLTEQKITDIALPASVEPKVLQTFAETIARKATKETFNVLVSNQKTCKMFVDWMSTSHGPETFVFTMVNHKNEMLLRYIIFEDYKTKETAHIHRMKEYMTYPRVCVIFYQTVDSVKILLDVFGDDIQMNTLESLLEKAEEALCVETALYMFKYISDRKSRSLATQ